MRSIRVRICFGSFGDRVQKPCQCPFAMCLRGLDLSQRDLEFYGYNEPFSLAHMDYEASLSLIWAPWDGVQGD